MFRSRALARARPGCRSWQEPAACRRSRYRSWLYYGLPTAIAEAVRVASTYRSAIVPLDRVRARAVLGCDPAKLGEFLERRLAPESAPAAGLYAAEGHRWLVVDGGVVDVADAGFKPARNVHRSVHISAEHCRGQFVLGVVSDAHRLLDAVDRHDRDDRPEGLFVVHPHIGRDAHHHSGLEVATLGIAACDHRGPLGDGILDVPGHALKRILVDDRTDLRVRLARVADLQRTGALAQHLSELVRDRPVDHDPLGRHADLPLVHERAEAGRRHGPVE